MISTLYAVRLTKIPSPADAVLPAITRQTTTSRALSTDGLMRAEVSAHLPSIKSKALGHESGAAARTPSPVQPFPGLSSTSAEKRRAALGRLDSVRRSNALIEVEIADLLVHERSETNLHIALSILERRGIKSPRIEQSLLRILFTPLASRICTAFERTGFITVNGALTRDTELTIQAVVPTLSEKQRGKIFAAIFRSSPQTVSEEILGLAFSDLRGNSAYTLPAAALLACFAPLTPQLAEFLGRTAVSPPNWAYQPRKADWALLSSFLDIQFTALGALDCPFPSPDVRRSLLPFFMYWDSRCVELYSAHLTSLAGLILRSVIPSNMREGLTEWLFKEFCQTPAVQTQQTEVKQSNDAPTSNRKLEATIEKLRTRFESGLTDEELTVAGTVIVHLFHKVYVLGSAAEAGPYGPGPYSQPFANQTLLTMSVGGRLEPLIETLLETQLTEHPNGDYVLLPLLESIEKAIPTTVWRQRFVACFQAIAEMTEGDSRRHLRMPAIAALAALGIPPSPSFLARVSRICREKGPEIAEIETRHAQSILFFASSEDITIAQWIAKMALRLPPAQQAEFFKEARKKSSRVVLQELLPVAELAAFSSDPELNSASLEFLRSASSRRRE